MMLLTKIPRTFYVSLFQNGHNSIYFVDITHTYFFKKVTSFFLLVFVLSG